MSIGRVMDVDEVEEAIPEADGGVADGHWRCVAQFGEHLPDEPLDLLGAVALGLVVDDDERHAPSCFRSELRIEPV